MTTMDSYFTPFAGLAGGSLIGLGAGTLLLVKGEIMGCAGITSSITLFPKKMWSDPEQYWKLVFLSSFSLTASLIFGPDSITDKRALDKDGGVPFVSSFANVLGGLLVGFGTRLGNGCTSGHGVCGLARMSRRSIAAVSTFMGVAFCTVYLTSAEASWANRTAMLRADQPSDRNSSLGSLFVTIPAVITTMLAPSFMKSDNKKELVKKNIPVAVSGALFSAGLAVSQMILPSKMFGFLKLSSGTNKDGTTSITSWDPTLATVFGGALSISMISYQFVKGIGFVKNDNALEKPLAADKFCIPTSKVIDWHLILGSALFGVGWGLSMMCPGPALFSATLGDKGMLYKWGPAYLVGSLVAQSLRK